MNIEWNRVTWYSWVAALVVFGAAFGIGIWVGMQIAETRNAAEMSNSSNASVSSTTAVKPSTSSAVIADVSYSCENGKKVEAVYTKGQVRVTTNTGTSITLPQTISADGGRYATANESFVFWSKGNDAFIQQTINGVSTTTYANCTQISSSTQ